MEIEPVSREGSGGFRELGGVRVRVLGGGRSAGASLLAVGGERGFDAEAAFPATSLGGGFLRSGEGEEAERRSGEAEASGGG